MAVELRVLTYNVRGLRDDRAALAHVVRACDPDVVCVQEAPKYVRWRAKCAALAREWGLLYVAGGGTTGGSALLAHLRVDVDDPGELCLSRQYGWPDRGVATATVRKGGAALSVASVHLPLLADQRPLHGRRILATVAGSGVPHRLVAGDLNEPPGGPAWDVLTGDGLRDADPQGPPTFPARSPRRRIDAVLVSDGVDVVSQEVVDGPAVERASDHLPVLAVVRVPLTG